MSNTISFSHSGNIGDTWAALPAIKQCYIQTGKKAILYLISGQRASYYEGATHPTKDSEGLNVQLNSDMINMMIPLLKAQSFIEDAKIWEGEQADVDMDIIRHTYVGMPNFTLQMYYFFVFPDLWYNLNNQWIEVPDADKNFAKGKILINRTERYTNETDYSFLKEYEDDCLFIGTMREYNNFCMNFDLNIPKVNVTSFLEFAQAIKQSKFYIGNQSQGFQLAEGMKEPRICELCGWAANVIPMGKDAYGFLNTDSLEFYFHKLNGTSEQYFEKLKSLHKEG
jgi:hypothetical protein